MGEEPNYDDALKHKLHISQELQDKYKYTFNRDERTRAVLGDLMRRFHFMGGGRSTDSHQSTVKSAQAEVIGWIVTQTEFSFEEVLNLLKSQLRR